MSYEVLCFNDVENVVKMKKLKKMIDDTCHWVAEELPESRFHNTTLKGILDDCGWRECLESLKIIDGRRYQYKGFLKRAAIEANMSYYEFLWEGLFRLQIGFDKGLIDMGILLLDGRRSSKSPLGNSVELVKEEVETLYPTISLPVMVVLFDLGMSGRDDAESQEDVNPAAVNEDNILKQEEAA